MNRNETSNHAATTTALADKAYELWAHDTENNERFNNFITDLIELYNALDPDNDYDLDCA